MIFDDFTKVQILSSDSNKFCPRLMKISPSEDFKCDRYQVDGALLVFMIFGDFPPLFAG
jgi:hypothetical protein